MLTDLEGTYSYYFTYINLTTLIISLACFSLTKAAVSAERNSSAEDLAFLRKRKQFLSATNKVIMPPKVRRMISFKDSTPTNSQTEIDLGSSTSANKSDSYKNSSSKSMTSSKISNFSFVNDNDDDDDDDDDDE